MGDRIPLFGLHTPLLPGTDLGIHVFEPQHKRLVAHALDNGHRFGVCLLDPEREPCSVGTLAAIGGYAELPDGRYLLEVEGAQRFHIRRVYERHYPMALINWLPESIGNFADARRTSAEVARLFRLYRAGNGDGDFPVHLPVDPVARSYVVASLLRVDLKTKQRLLEAPTAAERLGAELEILQKEIVLLSHLRSTR